MRVKLTNEDIRTYLDIEGVVFPKYVTQILNLANQNSQGTRPRVVGQMSDLITEFPGKTLHEWEAWYTSKKPSAIQDATEKVFLMTEKLKDAINKIDRPMVEEWVKDLVITKTFVGLRFQEAILRKGAELFDTIYSLAAPADESRGIDGYIGDVAVSIKPATYKTMRALSEAILVRTIYYEKVKDGIRVDFQELT
ncbi:MAG: MjaI family restriction endonuclease [Thermodesulfobacteriota bacterium]